MPTYEYQCQNCDVVFEEIHHIRTCPDVSKCPRCGSPATKILSLSAVFVESPTWIDNSLRNAIQGDNDPPITTRKELADHCKKHDLIPVG